MILRKKRKICRLRNNLNVLFYKKKLLKDFSTVKKYNFTSSAHATCLLLSLADEIYREKCFYF